MAALKTKSYLLVALLISIALVAAACGGDDEEAAAPTSAPQPTAASVATAAPTATASVPSPAGPAGSVTIAIEELPPLIQEPKRDIIATGGIGKDFSIYETIVRAPHVSPPNPPPQQDYSASDLGLAESWEVSSDLTSITFKLRPNIPWHDNFGDWGTMDENDVAWTFNSAFDLESVNNGAEEIGAELKKGFDIVGPMTVKMNIEPGGFDPTWVWLLGNAGFNGVVIVNKDAFDELGAEEYAKTPIGTGKYRALEWIGSDRVVMEAVEDHWTGITPSVKTITVVNMPEQATRDAALRTGEVDIALMDAQGIRSTVDAIGGRVQEIGIARPQGFQMAGNYWGLTCSDCEGGVMPRPGFDEALEKGYPWVGNPDDAVSMENARKVRQAMAMTVDQESIIEFVLEGFGRPIYTWQNILPDDALHKDEWIIKYDPEAARVLMAEAGYPDGFDYEIWIPSTFPPGTRAAAEAAAASWRQELKINATIDKTEYAARRPQTVDKTINVPFTHGINWIPGATSARYICPAAGHIVGFTMPDDLCALGLSNATEQSLTKRIANNAEIQDYLSEQMLFIPMFQAPALLYAVGPRIDQWDPYNSQDVFPNRPESITLK
ncbi:MAG: ABC transporter substrate-binding protein [Chloroflexi bacterium]|nr:ABC transporter substrate-binding protein [Chloroflexota bacterium]